MKRVLKITSLVALCLILVGTALGIFGWIAGGTVSFAYIPEEHKFITSSDEDFEYKEETLNRFSNIDIDLDTMNIVLKKGDDFTISYPDSDYCKTDFAVENDTLSVKTISTKKISFLLDPQSLRHNEITITVPKDVLLDNITGKTDAGNVEISDLEFETLQQEVDAGNISLKNVIGATGILTSDCGNIKLSKVTLGDLQIDSNTGNCKVESSSIYNIFADIDAGNINLSLIGAIEEYDINLNIDAGNAKVNTWKVDSNYTHEGNTEDHSIRINSDCGNVDIGFILQ